MPWKIGPKDRFIYVYLYVCVCIFICHNYLPVTKTAIEDIKVLKM